MRTLRAATTTLVALLALSACNSSDDPDEPMATSTPTGNSSTPGTPTADPPTESPKDETSRQFLRRWVELINSSQTSGDVAGFRAVSGPDCRSCRQFADGVESIYRAGGYIRSQGSKVTGIRHDGATQWTVELVAPPSEVKRSADEDVQQLGGGPYSYTVYISRLETGWSVSSYTGHTP